jgi:ABC-type Zn uptake system ZnuABC Zn-binding protein ZnuA
MEFQKRTGLSVAILLTTITIALLFLSACRTQGASPQAGDVPQATFLPDDMPELAPVDLKPGERLRVVATTSLVADVVSQIGQDRIELKTLLPPDSDPHTYQPTPQDLRAMADADAIFINGLGLEAPLANILLSGDGGATIVPVSAGIAAIRLDDTENDHAKEQTSDVPGNLDPHVWFSVPNVITWTTNIENALSQLDPAHAQEYAEAAQNYRAELQALDQEIREQVASIPPERRKLVTDHLVFNYFVEEYGFEQLGAIISSPSTAVQPSAQELAALQEQIRSAGVTTIFVGMSMNPELANRLAEDLNIRVVRLYTGALSDETGPASTYIEFMRYNVHAIVQALR